MFPSEDVSDTLVEYRAYELKLHGELMDVCRKYMNELSIVSIMGMLEIIKQEITELEQATRRDMNLEKSEAD